MTRKTPTRVWGYCPKIGFHASEIRKTFTRSTAAITNETMWFLKDEVSAEGLI